MCSRCTWPRAAIVPLALLLGSLGTPLTAAELEVRGFGGAVINDTIAVRQDLGNDFGFVLPGEVRNATFTVRAVDGPVEDLALEGFTPSFQRIDPSFGARSLEADETTTLSLRFEGIAGTGRVDADFIVTGTGIDDTSFLVGGATQDGDSPVLQPGLHTFSTADDVASGILFSDLDPEIRAFRYDSATASYDELPSDAVVVPKVGYFIANENPTQQVAPGIATTGTIAIDLQTGWGLYGIPALDNLTWDLDAIRIRRDGEIRTLRDAAALGWCAEYAWVWRVTDGTGSYRPVFPAGIFATGVATIGPWEAFWFLAEESGLEMLIDVGGGGTAVSTHSVFEETRP